MSVFIVRVKPGSTSPGVVQEDATHFSIKVRERAVDGKANDAVLRALAKHLGCAPSLLSLRAGLKSRTKRIEKI